MSLRRSCRLQRAALHRLVGSKLSVVPMRLSFQNQGATLADTLDRAKADGVTVAPCTSRDRQAAVVGGPASQQRATYSSLLR